jgi:hypothetical protein
MATTADRTKETTTTTGTGAITLAGAVSQFRTFATAFGASSIVVDYAIVGQGSTEWEVGRGTFNGTTSLTRDTVLASSNANGLVSFSVGTKDVFATINAQSIGAPMANRAPVQDLLVPAGYSMVVAGPFEIAAGVVVETAANAVLEIT